MNPWGVAAKDVPAGGCKLEITIAPAAAFAAKYGWHAVSFVNEHDFVVPEILTGLPWAMYDNASLRIGFSLASVKGQPLTIQKLMLQETDPRSNANLFAHIVLKDGVALTGWISTPTGVSGVRGLQ